MFLTRHNLLSRKYSKEYYYTEEKSSNNELMVYFINANTETSEDPSGDS